MPRTRAYDEEALLDAAIELFWVHGYRAASLTELTAETGVTNGSLYQAYGSKWVLFLAAYRRYCARRVALVAGVFDAERTGVEETVAAYFDAIVDDCLSHTDHRGCLMLNTISELGADDDIAQISGATIDAMEAAVARALGDVVPATTSKHDIDVSAAHAVALSQALIQLSRIGRDPRELRLIGRQAAASTQRTLLDA
ncbi:TetR/AcrR family transcriptional regulator [Herbiconiux ginsengi]|uniref:Transcriptional regulator, TetR family n=1 Tax=Herbiconiux ginsengi TaxID=381665 RepID=A0A1H3SZE2_9MICO|nr:TetR/AcrR family transcriptional regulator [Herbiconiux ginsengi]SDZ43493.1 transcriptional regulator, TetR family [Herbiconiux ginsengi]